MPLEVIPVIDLAVGRAVHAVGGERAHYALVTSALAPGWPGDAMALARAYRERVRAHRCYVADLDAITGAATQRRLLDQLASDEGFGGALLVDAGIGCVADLQRLEGMNVMPVVGLETLHHWDELPALLAIAPSLVFSLDLRAGEPLGRIAARPPGGSTAETIAVAVAAAGVREVILLDLARIGRPWGPDFARLAAVRAAVPDLRLLAGGGVRDAADLAHLEQIGVDGALLASALHRGTLAVGRDQSSASEVR